MASVIRFDTWETSTGNSVAVVNDSGDLAVSGNISGTLKSPYESWTVSATAATGTVDVDIATSSAWYYTTDASANWTFNFRGDSSTTLNSLLSTGESVTVVFLVTNGATAYYPTAFTVDSSSVTPEWSGGSAPSSGNASSIDSYLFTIIKTADATFTVLAQQVQFA